MDYKQEMWKQAKGFIDNTKVDDIERIDVTLNDSYGDTTDITIDIELKRVERPKGEQPNVTLRVDSTEYLQKLEAVANAVKELNDTQISVETYTE